MNLLAHLALGLIIGKITGNYPAALIGSLFVDLDHLIVYIKHGVLFDIKKLWNIIADEEDSYKGQRGYLHNVFSLLFLGFMAMLVSYNFGYVFFAGYFGHLIFDLVDSADFYPFYTSKVNIRWFISYFSKTEWAITIGLFIIYFVLLLFY